MRLQVNSKHGLLSHRGLVATLAASSTTAAPSTTHGANGALQGATKQLADWGALCHLLAATCCCGLVARTNHLSQDMRSN